MDKSLHNQARFQAIDDKRVEAYAEAMRRGDQFPPVIAHGRMGKLVVADGNVPTLPALVNSSSAAPARTLPDAPSPGTYGPLTRRLAAPPLAPEPCPWLLSRQVVEAFLGGYRGATRASYASDARDVVAFAADRGRPVLLLGRVDLDDYVTVLLQERRLAVSTVRRRLAVTSQLFTWAVDEGVLDHNPASRLRRPRPQAAPARVRLDAGQARMLLAAAEADGPRSAVLVHLLLLHGCRIGEVIGIDVDHLRGPRRARRVRLLGKGGVVREVPLAGRTSDLVEQLTDGATCGPLLRSSTGRRWHRTNAARHLRQLGQTVLPPDLADQLHPHALRRTFVDLGLAAGATLGELQLVLGHRTSAMVLVYAAQRLDGIEPVPCRVAAALRPHGQAGESEDRQAQGLGLGERGLDQVGAGGDSHLLRGFASNGRAARG